MIELLIGLLTAGGSAGFGSFLKIAGGIFDSWNKARETKAEAEFLREAREHEQSLEFQRTLMGTDNYSKHTRRVLAVIGMSTLSILTIWCAFVPELPLVTFAREAGDGSILFGLIKYPISAKTVTVTLGHIALVAGTVVYPMIVGFYFTPGGRK
jgi:hypothetical protein